jgi:hypothetical protein
MCGGYFGYDTHGAHGLMFAERDEKNTKVVLSHKKTKIFKMLKYFLFNKCKLIRTPYQVNADPSATLV